MATTETRRRSRVGTFGHVLMCAFATVAPPPSYTFPPEVETYEIPTVVYTEHHHHDDDDELLPPLPFFRRAAGIKSAMSLDDSLLRRSESRQQQQHHNNHSGLFPERAIRRLSSSVSLRSSASYRSLRNRFKKENASRLRPPTGGVADIAEADEGGGRPGGEEDAGEEERAATADRVQHTTPVAVVPTAPTAAVAPTVRMVVEPLETAHGITSIHQQRHVRSPASEASVSGTYTSESSS